MMLLTGYILVTFATCIIVAESEASLDGFPDDFLFGVATSAYQIEGAWNVSDKSVNIWDYKTHTDPESIEDRSSGDVACDSFHKTQEDVALLKDLGVDYYRFSLSWTRILPNPFTNAVSEEGITHYNKFIDLLLENGIQPMVTLFHWDLPQSLQELGGFANPLIIDLFVNYSRAAFENFGDRVKLWSTFNEPNVFCVYGHGKALLAPSLNQSGVADYLCGHNLLLAHANTYHLYKNEFKPKQKGKISININSPWAEPASSSPEDIQAADRFLQFLLGWFAHPILSKTGDYPSVMKNEIAKRSKAEGFPESRLPTFTKSEIRLIQNTCDYFALNHYNAFLAKNKRSASIGNPEFDKDMNVNYYSDPSWPETANDLLKVVPWGLTKLLKWIKENYQNPDIYITENGYSDFGDINDTRRINYYKGYLNATLQAMDEYGVKVKGYTAWSLMDNFEWIYGYIVKFGLYYVDFSDPGRPRRPKASVDYYKTVIATRKP